MNSSLISCTSLITNHFQLSENELSAFTKSEDELENALSRIINSLLDQDMQRLINACYKIDLSQEIFEKILTQAPTDQIGRLLAKEVVKRELQKVKTGEKYRNLSFTFW